MVRMTIVDCGRLCIMNKIYFSPTTSIPVNPNLSEEERLRLAMMIEWLSITKGRFKMKEIKRNYATHHKLSEQQVMKIYQNYKNNIHDEFELAEKFGVSLTTIYDIIRGRSWRWLNLEPIYHTRKPIW